jgi:hypothetical protein
MHSNSEHVFRALESTLQSRPDRVSPLGRLSVRERHVLQMAS